MILDKRFSYHVLVDMAVHTFKAGRNQCSCSVGVHCPMPIVAPRIPSLYSSYAHSSTQNTWMLFLRCPPLRCILASLFPMHPSDSPRYYSHVFHVRLRLHVVLVAVEMARQLVQNSFFPGLDFFWLVGV